MTFLDTNVCLDLLAKRSPWHSISETLIKFHIQHSLTLGVSVISLPTISFLLQRYHKAIEVQSVIKKMLVFTELLNVNRTMTKSAINSSWKDLEDAMQHECALAHKAWCIITRNKQDFVQSAIPVFTPNEWVSEFMN
jgi:predicted nucleic acid-binding protein